MTMRLEHLAHINSLADELAVVERKLQEYWDRKYAIEDELRRLGVEAGSPPKPMSVVGG